MEAAPTDETKTTNSTIIDGAADGDIAQLGLASSHAAEADVELPEAGNHGALLVEASYSLLDIKFSANNPLES